MNNNQRGIILLTTMMMIGILTLLVLSLMQGVFLYIKSSHQVMTNHQVFRQMEIMSTQLKLTNTDCMAQDKSPNQLVDMLLAKQGCIMTDGTYQYRYVVEEVGLYPCLQLVVDGELKNSHHWLVTVASMQLPEWVVQMRIARPLGSSTCELAMARQIHSGVISWRKIRAST